MTWLARQSFFRVVLIAAAWLLLVPVALAATADLYIQWLGWRDTRAGRASYYFIRLDFESPAAIVSLAAPPIALVITWWLLRRGE